MVDTATQKASAEAASTPAPEPSASPEPIPAEINVAADSSVAAQPEGEIEAPADGSEALVAFRHPFFNKLQMAYFRYIENTTEAVLMVEYGDQQVALSMHGIRKELELQEDDPDWKMLDLIPKGLKFVTTLSVGDPLPSEIISGKASWQLTPKHAQVAYQRLALKLMAWMTGGTADTSTATHTGDDILAQVQDPEVRKKIAAAFDEAAEALGLGRDRREEVVGYLESLAQELGYIEALRDRFARIVKVGRRLKDFQVLGKRQGSGQRVADVIDQGARLIRPAADQFVQLFKDTDALTAEIMTVLKNLEGYTVQIQEKRDEIHQRLNPWNEILDAWEKIKDNEITSQVVEAAARTVRMLAPRYMPTKEWTLRLKQDQQRKASVKSWRSPEMQREDINKVAGRIMRW
ncbi:MAG TPA: hypothetical protein VGG27_09305 [Magnetospirillaceae bacterium]